jgi:hypothetical protein
MFQSCSVKLNVSLKILVFIVLLLLLIPTFTINPSSNFALTSDFEDVTEFEPDLETHPDQQDTRGSILLTLKLKNSEVKTIKSKEAYRNVTVRDYATLIVENGELEINGTLTVEDNARFFVINSTVTISPPALPDKVIIVNFSDAAIIQIRDSTFITNPQPTHANISYLLSDDSTSVSVSNSTLIARLPTIPTLDINITPPTAGTYILSGETNWNVRNSYLMGNLSHNETGSLNGRWFWFTLQNKATMKLKNTNLWICDDSQPVIKPVSGLLEIEDCEILNGVIDAEVVSNLNIWNLTISHLNIRDQSEAVVRDCLILENLDIGSAATYSPIETGGSEPEAKADIFNTTVVQLVLISGNATARLQNCNLNETSISNNGLAVIQNSSLHRSKVYDSGELEFEYSSAEQIFIEKESKLTINTPKNNIEWVITKYNCKSMVTIINANIDLLEIYPGDNFGPSSKDPVVYGAGYNRDLNISNVYITLKNSDVNTVQTYDDEILTFDLSNSKINNFKVYRFKYENASFTIIDKDSLYELPDLQDFEEGEIVIQYEFGINLLLNNEPVKALIEILDDNKNIITSQKTDENGYAVFNLDSQIIDKSGSKTIENYWYKINYFGFQNEYELKLTKSLVHYINYTDINPPRIMDIEYGPTTWNLEKDVKVTVSVDDDGVQSIANVTLYYSKDNGKTWRALSMHEVENGQYETVIPKQVWGDQVEFYVEAYDILGNKAQTKPKSYTVAEEEFNVLVIILLAIIVITLIGIVKAVFNARKVKKYLNKKTSVKIKEAK